MNLPSMLIAQATPPVADFGAGILAAVMAFAAVFIVIGIVCIIGAWKVYTKAGQPGWAVLIPVYNYLVFLRIIGLPWYWVFAPLIVLIPVLGWFAYVAWAIWVNHRLSVSFGHGAGFTAGLLLLSPIFWLILGFGSSQYIGQQKAQA